MQSLSLRIMSSIEENMNIYQEGALLKRKKEKKKSKKQMPEKKRQLTMYLR